MRCLIKCLGESYLSQSDIYELIFERSHSFQLEYLMDYHEITSLVYEDNAFRIFIKLLECGREVRHIFKDNGGLLLLEFIIEVRISTAFFPLSQTRLLLFRKKGLKTL